MLLLAEARVAGVLVITCRGIGDASAMVEITSDEQVISVQVWYASHFHESICKFIYMQVLDKSFYGSLSAGLNSYMATRAGL